MAMRVAEAARMMHDRALEPMRGERALALDDESLVLEPIEGVAHGELRGTMLLGELRLGGNGRTCGRLPGHEPQMQIAANIEVQGQAEVLDASRRSPAKVIAPDAVQGLPHLSRPAVDRHVIPCALHLSSPIQKPILEQIGLHDRLARDPEMAGAAARALVLDGIDVRPHPRTALQKDQIIRLDPHQTRLALGRAGDGHAKRHMDRFDVVLIVEHTQERILLEVECIDAGETHQREIGCL